MMRFKRGVGSLYYYFLIIAVILGIGTFYNSSIKHSFIGHVGEATFSLQDARSRSYDMLNYLDLASHFSAEHALYALGQSGGGSSCGEHLGYALWNTQGSGTIRPCTPSPHQIQASFLSHFSFALGRFIGGHNEEAPYPLPHENYEFVFDGGAITGAALSDALIPLGQGEIEPKKKPLFSFRDKKPTRTAEIPSTAPAPTTQIEPIPQENQAPQPVSTTPQNPAVQQPGVEQPVPATPEQPTIEQPTPAPQEAPAQQTTTPTRIVQRPNPIDVFLQTKNSPLTGIGGCIQATEVRTAIPSSVILAVAIHETGWRPSQLAQKSKNLFGIKCAKGKDTYPGCTLADQSQCCAAWSKSELDLRYEPNEPNKYKVYQNWCESINNFADTLHQNSVYKEALQETDPIAMINEIKDAGYATDPLWARGVGSIAMAAEAQIEAEPVTG